MSRTIKEIRVSDRKREEVKEFVAHWFSENYFNVKEWDSQGNKLRVNTWKALGGFLLSPHHGNIVAVRTETYGCIVFEISLRESGKDTLVHGEFYSASALIFVVRELDLREKPPWEGRWPRGEGYILMAKFIESLESFSVKPES